MKATFPVKWKNLFKKLTIFMTLAIDVPLILFMIFRYISMGFNYGKTFEHLSLPFFFVLLFVDIPIFSVCFAFLISQYLRIATITISGGNITGRNYWMLKNTIPLSDITELSNFSNNGINAIVVNSKSHGKVYISEYTDRLYQLLGLLEPYLTHEENLNA
jgi:hypothetical protein